MTKDSLASQVGELLERCVSTDEWYDADRGPNLQHFVKWTFVILSQFFRANKLLYEKFTKELRKNYEKQDRLESYERVTKSLRKVYETIRNSLVTFS